MIQSSQLYQQQQLFTIRVNMPSTHVIDVIVNGADDYHIHMVPSPMIDLLYAKYTEMFYKVCMSIFLELCVKKLPQFGWVLKKITYKKPVCKWKLRRTSQDLSSRKRFVKSAMVIEGSQGRRSNSGSLISVKVIQLCPWISRTESSKIKFLLNWLRECLRFAS